MFSSSDTTATDNLYYSPMPAKVWKVLVSKGQQIHKGDSLIIVESMKMETKIYALQDSVVKQIFVKEGDIVAANTLLIELNKQE